ncbi:hypothetical protein ABTM07_19945, partial [Acinetobacter baumannii]
MDANNITVETIFNAHKEALRLTLTAGKAGMARTFTQEAIHNAAASADLVGHLNLIHPGRIQVIGHQELTYLINRAERRS